MIILESIYYLLYSLNITLKQNQLLKLSIIIPMYNVEQYIIQCLSSLYNQSISISDYEIIVIDDGSTDSSYNIAKEFSKDHTNLEIYRFKNAGLSEARNRGLKHAKGEYIFFIDSDDYIANNILHKLIECVINYSLDILEFKWIRTKSRDLYDSKLVDNSFDIKVLDGKQYIENTWIHDSVCTSFYRHEFLKKYNASFIKGRLMEDMIFNAKLIPKAKKVAYYPFDVYRYIINPNSIWTTTKPAAYRKAIYDFIFMINEFSNLIDKFEDEGINTSILKSKRQLMLFNTFKRILKSDLNNTEINEIIKDLKKRQLYPLNKYKGNEKYRKLLISVFNHKPALKISKFAFKILRKPIERQIIKKHQDKKEEEIRSTKS